LEGEAVEQPFDAMDVTGLMTVAWSAMVQAVSQVSQARDREGVNPNMLLEGAASSAIVSEAVTTVFGAAGVDLEYGQDGKVAISVQDGTPQAGVNWAQIFHAVVGVLTPTVQMTDLFLMVLAMDEYGHSAPYRLTEREGRTVLAPVWWPAGTEEPDGEGPAEPDDTENEEPMTIGGLAKSATLRALEQVVQAWEQREPGAQSPLEPDTCLALAQDAVKAILGAMGAPEPERVLTQEEWDRWALVDDILSGLLLAAIRERDGLLALIDRRRQAKLN
jgi:hypothetical protein